VGQSCFTATGAVYLTTHPNHCKQPLYFASGSGRRKKEAKSNAAAALLEHILNVSPGLVIRRYITLLNPTVAKLLRHRQHQRHQQQQQQGAEAVEGPLAAADPSSKVAVTCR